MKRRSFIQGSAGIALGQLLAGCGAPREGALRVRLLEDSVSRRLLRRFQQEIRGAFPLQIKAADSLQDLFGLLQQWQAMRQEPGERVLPANILTLGDYWLSGAIAQDLIQPLNPETYQGWEQIHQRWKAPLRRDRQGQIDDRGDIWAAPYRWGCTAIAYRQDRLDWIPSDWSDLWREELKHRIALPDSARQVIGLTLKKLGFSYNHEALDEVPELVPELRRLHQQVKFYGSSTYLEPLLIGNISVAVGSSADILPLIERYRGDRFRKIGAIVPASGTDLWQDVWVRPQASDPPSADAIQRWVEFTGSLKWLKC
ncbi:MAG: polyamine ABC transporter substrate-binding protein [Coleofasciculaceae cyanobacterium SM2_3_26]|nr:polyamine ABC transporter substrate-binding protein [Coleofasciculaceae cyanobacterium SM2_3_26]